MPSVEEIEQQIENGAIETEDTGEQTSIKPFDPSKIRVDQKNYNLGFLIDKLFYDEIDMYPDFLRSSNLWSNKQQSLLIESILLGLPLPSFYFSEDPTTTKWLVVDGLQRISTIYNFCVKPKKPEEESNVLKLEGLEFLTQHIGKTFDDLSIAEQRRIYGCMINLYVIDKVTPPAVKFLIFKRVNSGGLVLTNQEMRHALNQGVAAQFIKKLADSEEFTQATNKKIATNRQQDREFVNRFVAFYQLDIEKDYAGDLDNFLFDGMKNLATLSAEELKSIQQAFINSMKTCYAIFADYAFQRRISDEGHNQLISKTIFDTMSVNIAKLTTDEQQVLIMRKEILNEKFFNLCRNPEFAQATATATAQKNSVKKRFEMVQLMLQEVLTNAH